jgi:dienelactone hydrolase
MRQGRYLDMLIAVAAVAAIVVSLVRLDAGMADVTTEQVTVDGTRATVFRPASVAGGAEPLPAVLIAHGFAGSQPLMAPFATTFARNGHVAVTFDYLGHGLDPRPLTGSITETAGATRALVDQTARMAAFARTLGDGRLALLGHSMASDIVVRTAQADPGIGATIAVSMFSPAVTARTPGNLLVIVGGWEPGLKAEALRVVVDAGGNGAPGVTVGDPAAGTGRRAAFSPNVEHVGVLYSQASMAEAQAWLDAAFAVSRTGPPALDGRGPWVLLLLAGIVALGRPLSRLLPVVAATPAGSGLGWRAAWPCLVVPMVATPLVLLVLPTRFLPVLVGDYLAVHFGVYGLITALCLVWRGRRLAGARPSIARPSLPRLVLATVAVGLFVAGGLFAALDAYVANFTPVAQRVPLILAMLAGTAAYFLADEALVRGAGAGRGLALASRVALIVSLAGAVALDFPRLFFLMIIVPVIVPFFIVFGLFCAWTWRRTGHPAPGAIATAAAFAWAIGVTFPMVTG